MNTKQRISYISINILLILWVSIDAFVLNILNTTMVWAIGFYFYYNFLKGNNYKSSNLKSITVTIYLVWVVITCLYGIKQSSSYWDYKSLIYNGFALFLPAVIMSLSNIVILQKNIRMYIIYGIPAFFVYAIIAPNNTYGYYLAPVTLLLLFFDFLSKKHKLILVFFVVIVFLSSLGARSTIISFGFSILLLMFYYTKFLNRKWILNTISLSMLIAPFLLFSLAATGIFNVFKIEENSGTELKAKTTNREGKVQDENLLADTRTDIYEEVILSSIHNDYWLYGRSPARGNDTVMFAAMSMVEGRSERLRNEVGICNIYTWTGLIGVVLYFLIFLKATYLAVNFSKNRIVKIIGLYVAFRWFNSWVAEITNFDLINFTIWMAVAMCYSASFRQMSDRELMFWIKGITEKKYNVYFLKKNIKSQKNKI